MSEQPPRFDPAKYKETMREQWQSIDPVIYRETMREQWQSTAEGWHRWIPVLRAWVGDATELMLDLAQVGTGGGFSTSRPAMVTSRCWRRRVSARPASCSLPT